MRRILLACAAGMSTSMLVQRMNVAAEELEETVYIKAVSVPEVESEVNSHSIDILLLGPQVRYEEAKMQELLSPKNIPVKVIEMVDYGLMDGKAVLTKALKQIEG